MMITKYEVLPNMIISSTINLVFFAAITVFRRRNPDMPLFVRLPFTDSYHVLSNN
jgi:hypothetical protein